MKKNNVLWLGFAVPNSIANTLFALDPLPAIQTHKFGWCFARSLRYAFGNVSLASSCPVQNYPLVARFIFRREGFICDDMHGILLGFINVILLKHLTRLIACFTTVAALVRQKEIDWIFIHGVHSPYLFFGLFAGFAGRRMVVVLTDPPGLFQATDGRFARWLKRFDVWLVKLILRRADAVISLAPDLAYQLAPGRPALVFPGILESKLDLAFFLSNQNALDINSSGCFTILYAGGLSAAYGVDRLVEAVLGLEDKILVRLKLFGRGDQEDRVRELSATNSRIFYGGFVEKATLLPELRDADLLINPRPTTETFARLSFPSKLIEYLATAKPVLTTRIPSIPAALKDHYYFIEDESAQGIRAAIKAVMQLPALERQAKGLAAQRFAQSEYSEVALGKKISDFVKSLNFNNQK